MARRGRLADHRGFLHHSINGRALLEAAESSSVRALQQQQPIAKMADILSESLLVAAMHSYTTPSRFGAAGVVAAASIQSEELLLHTSAQRHQRGGSC